MSFFGLAPFVGIYGKPKTIRVHVPLIVYNIFLIIIPIFLITLFTELHISYAEANLKISVLFLAQFAYFIILYISYFVVLIASTLIASNHAHFLNSFVVFHEKVCALNHKDQSGSPIVRLVFESIVCNLIWGATIFHQRFEFDSALESLAYCFMITVIMTFMFHIRLIICLLRNDLKTIRLYIQTHHLESGNSSVRNASPFLIFENFINIKEIFETVLGKTLVFCAIFDFVMLVVNLYMLAMFFIVIEITWFGLFEGCVAYMSPFMMKNIMLAKASDEVAKEVYYVY